jgi:hypothetical protein
MAAGRDINSIMAGWVDRGPWTYYDTLILAQGTTFAATYSMYSTPIGAQDPYQTGNVVKTKLNTNMVRGNQFPPPRCLVLMQVGWYFSSQMLKGDIDKFLDNCYLEFRIDDKIFWEGQPWQFPAGFGLAGVTTASGTNVMTNGIPAPQFTRRYGGYSKYIAPLQQFSWVWNFPGTPPTLATTGQGGSGMYAISLLDGLTDRAVQ